MKIKVYNTLPICEQLGKYPMNEKGEEFAVFKSTKDNLYLLMDFECCGCDINGLDDTIEIPMQDKPKDGIINIIPMYKAVASLREFLEQATCREVEHTEFFNRRNYNPRLRQNYSEMISCLRDMGIDLEG